MEQQNQNQLNSEFSEMLKKMQHKFKCEFQPQQSHKLSTRRSYIPFVEHSNLDTGPKVKLHTSVPESKI